MSSDESDIEIKSALNKKAKIKLPKSPSVDTLKNTDPKKISTKVMVRAALTDLRPSHSRKGVSIQAIKKYIYEKFNYDVVRYNYILKNFLKSAVESGMILQVKGIGASGSFRLADIKEKVAKKKKMIAKEVKSKEFQAIEDKSKAVEEKKKKLIKPKKVKVNGSKEKVDKKTVKPNDSKDDISKKNKPQPIKAKTDKNTKQVKEQIEKKKVVIKKDDTKKEKNKKSLKDHKTPAKKRAAMMKRKSIGSIIKPPKMKPKAK